MSELCPEGGRPFSTDCFSPSDVTDYLRGELDVDRCADLESHVLVCARCCGELESQSRVVDGLSRLRVSRGVRRAEGRLADSRSVARSVFATVSAEERARQSRSWLASWRAAAAAAAVIALLGTAAFTLRGRGAAGSIVEDSTSRGAVVTEETLEPLEDEAAAAVARGLSWLVVVQEADGGWSSQRFGGRPEFDIGVSALAVLALSESENARHLRAARRGADFLGRLQARNGVIGEGSRGSIYNHSLATRALLACWERRDAILDRTSSASEDGGAAESGNTGLCWKPSIDAALDYLVMSQDALGSWALNDTRSPVESSSLTTWPLECLSEARRLGWRNLDSTIRLASTWIHAEQLRRGRAEISEDETLSWIFRRSELSSSQASRRTIDRWIAHAEPDYHRVFLVTRALRNDNDEGKRSRRRDAARRLLARQESGGSFPGSWEPVERWSVLGGRLCSTALATLALDNRD